MGKQQKILILLVLLLGGYYGWDLLSTKRSEKKEAESKLIVKWPHDQIHRFILERAVDKVELVRSTQGWDLKQPLEDAADFEAVESFVSAASADKVIDSVVKGENIDWALYGLDKPAVKVVFYNNLNDERYIEVSSKKNFEDNVYARIQGQPEVVTVNSNWLNRSQKTALDFRDRRVLRKKIASIQKLKIFNPMETLEIINDEGTWRSLPKKDMALDQEKVRSLVQSLVDARIMEYVASPTLPATKAKEFGLGKPKLRLELNLGDEKLWTLKAGMSKDLLLGGEISEPAHGVLFESGALDALIHARLESLRDKTLPFKFDRDLVSEIKIETQLKKSHFKKQEGRWELVDGAAGLVVQDEQISLLLTNLRDSKLSRYLSEPVNLKSLANRLQLLNDKGEVIFEMGWQDKEAGKKFVLKTSVHPEGFEWTGDEFSRLPMGKLAVDPTQSQKSKEEKSIEEN